MMEKKQQNPESYIKSAFAFDRGAIQLIIERDSGRIFDANESAVRFYGWSREELQQMYIGQINTLGPVAVRKIIEDIDGENQNHFEFRHRLSDNSIRDVDVYTSSIFLDNKEYLHSIIFDITDRKRIEMELAEREALYRSILQASPDMVIFTDLNLKIYFASPKSLDIFGLEKEDRIIGHNFLDFVRKDRRQQSGQAFESFIKGDSVAPDELLAVKADGTEFFAEINVGFIRNADDESTGLVIIARNVSSRKLAERQLRESEEKYRSIFDNAPLGIFRFDNRGVITECNDLFVGIIGSSRNVLIGLDMHRLENQQIIANLKITLEGETTVYEGDYRSVTGGKTTPVRVIFSAVFGESGMVEGGVGIVEDITERKRSEEALATSEDRFKSLIELAVDAILLGDSDGNIIGINMQAAHLTGYPKEELLGANIGHLFTGEELKRSPLRYDLLLKGETVRNNRLLKRKDGMEIPVEMNTKVMPDKTYQSFIRDMTERNRAEEELRKALEKARESDRLKSAFLANMSHEIRTPMNGILGFAELLKSTDLTGEKKDEYIDIIQKSGLRMLNIINDLIDISKVESGQMELHLSEVDINEQLDFLYSFFEPEAGRKGISLHVVKGLSYPDSIIESDREKLIAILTNLVKNAMKFTQKGSVSFGYSAGAESYDFFVKDTGSGIPPDKLELIFERFVQADLSISKPYEGAGLGLAITRAYVDMLGGRIRVDSSLDVGSTFYFSLPCVNRIRSGEKKTSAGIKFIPEVPARKIRALIAEDEETSMKLLSIIIDDYTCEILKATTGEEAVELFREHSDLDLVLMDIKMPLMDGYEATRRIREISNDVIIIAQSAYGLSGDQEKALAAGCNDYVVKPVSPDILKGKIFKYFT